MSEHAASSFPHFRLNFEQQQQRARELLKDARAGDADTLARFHSQPPTLAEAQYLIARELRFDDWARLKRHISRLGRERRAMHAGNTLDAELRTLHIRCGSDLKIRLQEAGFAGDFYEHNYPYLIGPVREGPDSLEQRARFLADERNYDEVLEALRRAEQTLQDSADYERVVIWSELDCYDQLVLVRLLGHYATHRRPPLLELVNVGDFPGGTRFIGLGQLPPEALRLLWAQRAAATEEQLALGRDAWHALASDDPRELAALMRSGTPALPLLAAALHRHLRELPSTLNGLSFTEEMALRMLGEESHSLNRMFVRMTYAIDPLPGQGDFQVRDRVLGMEGANARVFTRAPGVDREGNERPPWTDVLTITDLGRRVLAGELDFRSLVPPPRWVGGVQVGEGRPDWRWDEGRRDTVRVSGGGGG
jgi:hypothetical protein